MDFSFTREAFRPGDFVVYSNGGDDHIGPVEIGVVKRVCEDGCFVAYHLGDTVAKTPFRCLIPIENDYAMYGLCRRAAQLGKELGDLSEGCEDWTGQAVIDRYAQRLRDAL